MAETCDRIAVMHEGRIVEAGKVEDVFRGDPADKKWARHAVTYHYSEWSVPPDWKQALVDDPHLRNGLNIAFGKVTCQPVAEALGYAYVEPALVMG